MRTCSDDDRIEDINTVWQLSEFCTKIATLLRNGTPCNDVYQKYFNFKSCYERGNMRSCSVCEANRFDEIANAANRIEQRFKEFLEKDGRVIYCGR